MSRQQLTRSKQASTKSNASSTVSTVSAHGPLAFLTGCFSPSDPAQTAAERLAYQIHRGNTSAVERILRKLRVPPHMVVLSVKRRHLSPNFVAWSNRNQDPFLHFHQECSPVIWAIDNQQWQMLPILARYGFDPNRPMICRRWNYVNPSGRTAMVPYKKFWTKGRYTYQSALDYYFGSIYEFLDEDMRRPSASATGQSAPSSFYHFFQQLPQLLLRGVDVHRIDSIILFNSLGYSLNWYLTRYTNANNTVPDIPEQPDSCAEMYTVQALIRSGFSQFECLEFLSSSHNLFGTLICLLCHPKLDAYAAALRADADLPPVIQEAALLLINMLCLRATHPTSEEMRDSLENLSLRKLYAKRYSERRLEFNTNLDQLLRGCQGLTDRQPLSLCLMSRNAVRRRLGGVNFREKVRQLQNCPAEISAFITYMDLDCLHLLRLPRVLLKLAKRQDPFHHHSVRESQS